MDNFCGTSCRFDDSVCSRESKQTFSPKGDSAEKVKWLKSWATQTRRSKETYYSVYEFLRSRANFVLGSTPRTLSFFLCFRCWARAARITGASWNAFSHFNITTKHWGMLARGKKRFLIRAKCFLRALEIKVLLEWEMAGNVFHFHHERQINMRKHNYVDLSPIVGAVQRLSLSETSLVWWCD